ncbi:unnamed protein product [Caenorhabditis angaria]|uniref:EXPERA domain-containing protein n=1 Tax=Caenorhabditis angaria TaxID=860376 RepID=A0A9P1I8E4_9PELO|nr:unnamed protein product [Caenorhabditis angaria]
MSKFRGFKEEDYRPSVLPSWISWWLIFSGVVCTIDVLYTMNRPYTNDRSQPFHSFVFAGWHLYSNVDRQYRETNNLVTTTTGRVMLLECFLNFLAVGMANARSRHAILLAFTTNLMVWWKTVMYFTFFLNPPAGTEELFNQNYSYFQMFMIFWVPNGIWMVFPTLILIVLWNRLALPPKLEEQYWKINKKCRGELTFEADD